MQPKKEVWQLALQKILKNSANNIDVKGSDGC